MTGTSENAKNAKPNIAGIIHRMFLLSLPFINTVMVTMGNIISDAIGRIKKLDMVYLFSFPDNRDGLNAVKQLRAR